MMNLKNKSFYILAISTILIVFNSCYIDKRMAYSFVDDSKKISILIFEPDLFLKTNLKTVNTNEEKLEEESDFLHKLDVEWALSVFMAALTKELSAYGIGVYTSKHVDTFFSIPPPAHIINIAQIEIEEFYAPFKDTYERSFFDNDIYVQEFLLNALNFNTWFEYSELNTDSKKEVLFSNFYISDDINGRFFVESQTREVKYAYSRVDIEEKDVEELLRFAGKTNAQYIFNYLLNKHIRHNLSNRIPSNKFYHYNRSNNRVYVLENYEQFRLIE